MTKTKTKKFNNNVFSRIYRSWNQGKLGINGGIVLYQEAKL